MLLLLGAAVDTGAVGFGNTDSATILGRPLSFSIPLRLEEDEILTAECLSADVYNGPQKLAPHDVRVRLLPGATPNERVAQVITLSPVSEPVVEVDLRAGCERRYARRYTAFADPPSRNEQAAPVSVAQAPIELRPQQARPILFASNAPVALPGIAPASAKPAQAASEPRRRAGKASETQASVSKRATRKTEAAAAPARPTRASADAALVRTARLLLEVAPPTLKLDLEEPLIMPAGSIARAPATEPGSAPAAAVTNAERTQLRQLERTVAELRRQVNAQRETNEQLTARLAEAESATDWSSWIWGLAGVLTLSAAGVALRLRQRARTRAQEAEWWADSRDSALDSALPDASGAEAQAADGDSVEPSGMPHSGWEQPDPHDDATGTDHYGAANLQSIETGFGPVREVSAEELMDLEQQAAFLIGLGQDDAAIELLRNHLRSGGGMSPLPYMKLLEVHHRRNDRTAYDRVSSRYSRRFGARAPGWEAGPLQGRTLEDYPQIVEKINAMWASPREAMGFLEAVLFHVDASMELLDLPAYPDVLLLYSIARELSQMPVGDLINVDFELPLNELADEAPAAPEALEPPLPQVDPQLLPPSASKWLDSPLALEPEPAEPAEAGVQATLDTSRLRG